MLIALCSPGDRGQQGSAAAGLAPGRLSGVFVFMLGQCQLGGKGGKMLLRLWHRVEVVNSSCPSSLQLPLSSQTHTTEIAAQPGEVYLEISCTGHSEAAGTQPRCLQQVSRDFPSTVPTRK